MDPSHRHTIKPPPNLPLDTITTTGTRSRHQETQASRNHEVKKPKDWKIKKSRNQEIPTEEITEKSSSRRHPGAIIITSSSHHHIIKLTPQCESRSIAIKTFPSRYHQNSPSRKSHLIILSRRPSPYRTNSSLYISTRSTLPFPSRSWNSILIFCCSGT